MLKTALVWWSGLAEWQEIRLSEVNSGWLGYKDIWTAWYLTNDVACSMSVILLIPGKSPIQGTTVEVTPAHGHASEAGPFTLDPGQYDITVQVTVNGIVAEEYVIQVISGEFIQPLFLTQGEGTLDVSPAGPYQAGQSVTLTATNIFGVWKFVYFLRNDQKWLDNPCTFNNLQSGETFIAVFEELAVFVETRIVDFRVEPAQSSYMPGDTVHIRGKLQFRDPVWRDGDSGYAIKLYSEATEWNTKTTELGWFSFLVALPYLAGIYEFYARYPGKTFPKIPACNSATLEVDVVGDSGNYVCPYCAATFSTQELLNQHIESVHGGYVCPYCGLVFNSQSLLDQHIESVHGDGDGDGGKIPWDKIAIGAAVLAGVLIITVGIKEAKK
jgi:uncharacterized Zn-finger protein